MTSEWVAYVDESIRAKAGAYLLAAACFDAADCAGARKAVSTLASPGQRFHWRQSTATVRAKAVAVVTSLPALHLVVAASPLDPHRQERARRHCLRRLLSELDSAGVRQVWLEWRDHKLNDRDLQMVNVLRIQQVIRPGTKVKHAYPAGPDGEPLLWVPDIVAGAVGAELDRGSEPVEQLARLVSMHRVRLG